MRSISLKAVEFWAALLLTGEIVGLLACRAVQAGALWRDECAAVQLATSPTVGEVLANFQHEAFPPPFFLLLRGLAAVAGDGDAALRALGCLAGVLLIAALWWNSWTLSTSPPLASLALLGLNTQTLIWGSTLRGYGVGAALMAAAFGALWKVRQSPTPSWIAAALMACVFSVQMLLFNAPLLLAVAGPLALAAAWRGDFRMAGLVLGIGAVSALSLLPYFQACSAAGDWTLLVRLPFGPTMFWEGLLAELSSPEPAMICLWCNGVLGGVCGVAIYAGRRDNPLAQTDRDDAVIAAGTLAAALVLQYAALQAVGYVPRPWYFLSMLTVIACCTDLIWGRLARLIAAVLGGLATLPGNLHAIGIPTTNMDRVAAALQQQARSGDLIVVNPWYQGLSFGRYYRGDADWTTLPILAEKRIHRFDLIKQKMQAVGPLDDLVVSTRSTLQAGGSVWIVGDLDPLPIRQPIKPLPPAPHGSAGWSEAAYQTNWSQQYTRFLQLAALSIDPVPVPGGVSFPEQASLSVARGWREPQPAAVRPAP